MPNLHELAQRLIKKTGREVVDPNSNMTGINLGSLNSETTQNMRYLYGENGQVVGLELNQTITKKGAFFQGFTTGGNPDSPAPSRVEFKDGNIDVTLE